MHPFPVRQPSEPLSELAAAGLRDLAARCTQHNGFGKNPEKVWAVRTLRALRFTAREKLDPRAVEEWAASDGGWSDRHARDLRKIVEGVYQTPTKRFRDYDGSPIRYDEAVERAMVQRWRDELDRNSAVLP